jgi:hypothetical protein
VASAQHDNDRAWKRLVNESKKASTSLTTSRLKTRERFVQLSEASLQEKKKHCKFFRYLQNNSLILDR